MTNYEKYKDEIISRIVDDFAITKDGELNYCNNMECEDCIFFDRHHPSKCTPKIEEWLNEEYLEISKEEKVILDMLPDDAEIKKTNAYDKPIDCIYIYHGSFKGYIDIGIMPHVKFDWLPKDVRHTVSEFRYGRVRE